MKEIERAIGCAVRAAAFRQAALDYPRAKATFVAAAEVNSRRVGALLGMAMGTVGAVSARTAQR